MKTGLVLEGGAMRGMFTCGVMDVLMEQNISFDGAVGISAGAAFGCNYKSRQPGRPYRYAARVCRDWRWGSVRSYFHSGDLYDVDFCYREIPFELDPFDTETFSENPMEFWVGATDADTGRAVFHQCRDGLEEDLTWIRASASLPFVSRPVIIEGHRYLDGGLADAIPLAFLEQRGYEKNVVILTRPDGYRKKKSPASGLMAGLLHGCPGAARAMHVRDEMYNGELDYIRVRESAGKALVIRPPVPLTIGKMEKDPEKYRKTYEIGRQAGLKYLQAVRTFLNLNP